MSEFATPRVPVAPEDQQRSYYKYYHEPMAPADPQKYAKVLAGPIDPSKALPFQDRNRLFEPGYLEEELGYCVMPDGTGYLANLTQMPGVTAEMFDWWFAWHGLNDLRYTIWDPEDHYYARSMQKNKALDPDLSLKEKYWDTTHDVLEDTGMGPEGLYINLTNPRSELMPALPWSVPRAGEKVSLPSAAPAPSCAILSGISPAALSCAAASGWAGPIATARM